jgi:CRISPR-associated protein Csb1
MNEILKRLDPWLDENGPAALVIREHLASAEGPDAVVFPATFAPSQDGTSKGGYNIDPFNEMENVCLIDSVGSQANRIEPLFMKDGYADLVPKVVVKAGEKTVNLLEAGHRAADAIFRCSELQEELRAAFKALQNGNAEPLAKVAPTSLVFGAWDSRDTQAKLPRLIASTIRAFNVRKLTRSAAYIPPVDHIAVGNIPDYTNDIEKKKYSERGWLHAVPSGTPGGVIAKGGIRRDASLHLAALRLLYAGSDARTMALRRYILGLALTAFTYSPSGYLRQGCNLVLDPDKPREFSEVYGDGRRAPVNVAHTEALEYTRVAVGEFGIGPNRSVDFDRERAKRDLSGESADGRAKKPRSKN